MFAYASIRHDRDSYPIHRVRDSEDETGWVHSSTRPTGAWAMARSIQTCVCIISLCLGRAAWVSLT